MTSEAWGKACGDVESKLENAVREGQWQTVDDLLQNRVNVDGHRHAVVEGLERAGQPDILRYILPHCTGAVAGPALDAAVSRGVWQVVGALLQQGASEAHHHRALAAACTRASQPELIDYILPWFCHNVVKTEKMCTFPTCKADPYCYDVNCYGDRLRAMDHSVIATLVQRGLWRATRYLLRHIWVLPDSDSVLQWVVMEAVQRASDENLSDLLLQYASPPDGDIDFALKVAVDRRLWRVVSRLLSDTRLDDPQNQYNMACYSWVFMKAVKHASDEDLSAMIRQLNTTLVAIKDIESVLSRVLERHLWLSLCELLSRSYLHEYISQESSRRAVEEAITHADVYCIGRLLPGYADVHAEQALALAVRRGLWGLVAKFLKMNVGDDCYRKAVEEGLKRADDLSLIEFILPHCGDNQTDLVLEETVRRGIWGTVRQLLKKRVSDAQRRRAVHEAVRFAADTILRDILPLCADDELDFALTEAVSRGLWDAAGVLLKRGVTDTQTEWTLGKAIQVAEDHELSGILPFCSEDQRDSVLTQCVQRDLWYGASQLLQRGVGDRQRRWTVEEASRRAHYCGLRLILSYCAEDQLVDVFTHLIRRNILDAYSVVEHIKQHISYDSVPFLTRCLAYWLVAFINCKPEHTHDLLLTSRFKTLKQPPCADIIQYILLHVTSAVEDSSGYKVELTRKTQTFIEEVYGVCCAQGVRFGCNKTVFSEVLTASLETFFASYGGPVSFASHTSSFKPAQELIVLPVFALQTNNPVLQGMVLPRKASPGERVSWAVVSHVDVSRVCEEVRRSVLQAAVEEKQWMAVKHLADHTLYDDQRNWLMKMALEEKLWDVVAVLADHGLTSDQLRRAHRQVAKHADWEMVRQLFTRGANLKQVREDLETANPSRLRPPYKRELEEEDDEFQKRLTEYKKIEDDYKRRVRQLKELESELREDARNYTQAVKEMRWDAVMYQLCRGASREEVDLTLAAAIEGKATHVLDLLIRLWLDATQRNALFARVVSDGLWGAGRALLERPWSMELFADFGRWETLRDLMEAGQWILVARVMEYGVGDELRRRVMWEVLNRREGSVVAHIIGCMEGGLTVDERETVFQGAITHGLWQAVRCLVEEEDDTGIKQRDKAMFAAMKQERWDVVQHCVKHGADIDKLDATGLTQLQRAVKERRGYPGVEGLLHQGADNRVVDSDGDNVLLACIKQCGNLDVTKILVEFHGDINQLDRDGHNALYHLISRTIPQSRFDLPEHGRLADILECALLWGRHVGEMVNSSGKTVLHVMCQNQRHDAIRYFVARGVDPLAITDKGESLLLFAVKSKNDALRLVAECIKLGVTTHQPRVTDFWFTRDSFSPPHFNPAEDGDNHYGETQTLSPERCSPFQHAYHQPIILDMLYETRSCSNSELYRFYLKVMHAEYGNRGSVHYSRRMRQPNTAFLDKVKKMARCPRSLQSLCRLVISHHVGVAKPRVRESSVQRLPVLSRVMKAYVLFKDILHKDFGKT